MDRLNHSNIGDELIPTGMHILFSTLYRFPHTATETEEGIKQLKKATCCGLCFFISTSLPTKQSSMTTLHFCMIIIINFYFLYFNFSMYDDRKRYCILKGMRFIVLMGTVFVNGSDTQFQILNETLFQIALILSRKVWIQLFSQFGQTGLFIFGRSTGLGKIKLRFPAHFLSR